MWCVTGRRRTDAYTQHATEEIYCALFSLQWLHSHDLSALLQIFRTKSIQLSNRQSQQLPLYKLSNFEHNWFPSATICPNPHLIALAFSASVTHSSPNSMNQYRTYRTSEHATVNDLHTPFSQQCTCSLPLPRRTVSTSTLTYPSRSFPRQINNSDCLYRCYRFPVYHTLLANVMSYSICLLAWLVHSSKSTRICESATSLSVPK